MSDLTERARTSDGYRVVKEPTGSYIKADTELIRELADCIDVLEERVHELERQLGEAILDIKDWAAYADEYFQLKWDLKGDLDRHQRVLDQNPIGEVDTVVTGIDDEE